jgi:hypothetical protein
MKFTAGFSMGETNEQHICYFSSEGSGLGSRCRRSSICGDRSRASDFTPRLTLRITIKSRPAINLAAFYFV